MRNRITMMHRRTFLRGLGGTFLALPVLPSLWPRGALAATEPQKRVIFFVTFNGVNQRKFWPDWPSNASSGDPNQSPQSIPVGYSFPLDANSFTGKSLAPLSGMHHKLLIPRGYRAVPMLNTSIDQHQLGAHKVLTAELPDLSGAARDRIFSIDQVLASHFYGSIGDGTPARAPLLLGVDVNSSGSVSFSRGNRVAMNNNPASIYGQFVGLQASDPESPAPTTTRDHLADRRQSILDLVAANEFERVMARRLGRDDRLKVESHFELVRSIERRVQEIPEDLSSSCAPLSPAQEAELNSTLSYPALGRLQVDLAALAIACGQAQVAVIQWHRPISGKVFNFDGLNHVDGHHPLSHLNGTGNNAVSVDVNTALSQLFDIDQWHAQRFRQLLDRLDSYEEGDGRTALDNSVAVWMHDLSDGQAHSSMNMPYVLAGSLGGYLRTGEVVNLGGIAWEGGQRHVGGEVHNKLFTTILRGVGASPSNFDDFGPVCTPTPSYSCVPSSWGQPTSNPAPPHYGLEGETDLIKA